MLSSEAAGNRCVAEVPIGVRTKVELSGSLFCVDSSYTKVLESVRCVSSRLLVYFLRRLLCTVSLLFLCALRLSRCFPNTTWECRFFFFCDKVETFYIVYIVLMEHGILLKVTQYTFFVYKF